MHAWTRIPVAAVAGVAALAGAERAALAEVTTASSASFVVMAPDRTLAEKVAQRAEALRTEISKRWLGDELGPPNCKAGIHLTLDPSRTTAATSVHDNGESHLTWIIGSESDCTGNVLAHEVAHTVLANRFGARMPSWANEGIACQYDNPYSRRIRADLLRGFVTQGDWPNLAEVMTAPVRSQREYAAAVSVTEFLLSLDQRRNGPPEQLYAFVETCEQQGCDAALRAHYGIRDLRQLQREWQAWVRAAVHQSDERLATRQHRSALTAAY